MGYKTPNIDRIGEEGMMFTDYYSEQSCTAGRAAFITGQSVFRTGNSKVGMPKAGVREQYFNRSFLATNLPRQFFIRNLVLLGSVRFSAQGLLEWVSFVNLQ